MKINSVKGTNDFLPFDAEIRDYIQSKILETYENFGFKRIYTPILEDIENLEKSEGGENLNLIYKVMKRGEKLLGAIEEKNFNALADLGLRYDLTLPLSRFYAGHKNNLPDVFKCIQIDQVFRAERPQRGRDREFVQCDIDVLGSKSPNCEIELIDVTAQALLNIGIDNFCVKINNRNLLREVLISFGFLDSEIDSVCITFDKLDKINAEGVKEELLSKGFNTGSVDKLYNFILNKPKTIEELKKYIKNSQATINLEYIINSVEKVAGGKYKIEFDISLVRGQGYYTGTVFEIKSLEFGGSIGGGGRYDKLIGKFLGEDVPAVGFSIGFERIYLMLKEKNFKVPQKKRKLALIYGDNDFVECFSYAKTLKDEYLVSLFLKPKKIGKLFAKLENEDFDFYLDFEKGKEIKNLKIWFLLYLNVLFIKRVTAVYLCLISISYFVSCYYIENCIRKYTLNNFINDICK